MPRPKESFESRMRKLRLKTGLSLKQLANETGYSSEYLKKIEKGQVIPPVSAIIQIAKALSVESGTFLSATESLGREKEKELSGPDRGICLSNPYSRSRNQTFEGLPRDRRTKKRTHGC